MKEQQAVEPIQISFSELPNGVIFYPVGRPHRRLQNHEFCITNEKMELIPPFRPDVPCIVCDSEYR